jgi:hypothetical protein
MPAQGTNTGITLAQFKLLMRSIRLWCCFGSMANPFPIFSYKFECITLQTSHALHEYLEGSNELFRSSTHLVSHMYLVNGRLEQISWTNPDPKGCFSSVACSSTTNCFQSKPHLLYTFDSADRGHELALSTEEMPSCRKPSRAIPVDAPRVSFPPTGRRPPT